MPRTIQRRLWLLSFIVWSCASPLFAQPAPIDSTLDHEVLVKRLRNAKDLQYRDALWHYQAYLLEHPTDVRIHVERCAFIGTALYDEGDEYNPNQEALDSCLSALGAAFPNEPTVYLARMEELWGEDRIALLKEAEAAMQEDGTPWSTTDRACLLRELASAYHSTDATETAYYYLERLCAISQEDRSSLLRAQVLAARDADEAAREALNMRTDTSEGLWGLQQRASLLLELNDPVNALRVYRAVEELDSAAVDFGELALTLEGAGQQGLARLYFVRDTVGRWNAKKTSLALFEHDLQYHGADTCLSSYNAFRDHGFAQDPLALSRLHLFVTHPMLPWKARDLLGLLCIVLLAMAIVLVPYLWVLPVHFIGNRWPQRKRPVIGAMRWGLKDFWWVSAAFLLASLFSVLVCPPCARSYFQEEWNITALTTDQEGGVILAFVLACAALILPVLLRTGLKVLRSAQWDLGRTLGTTVGYFLLFRFLSGIYVRASQALFGVEDDSLVGFLNGPAAIANSEVLAFHGTYGTGVSLFVMAALVPVYEEVMFRGVILNSVTRYLGFGWANIIQAALFSAVHGELLLAPYFFAFGMVVGVLTKRSESLQAGILFHVLNNLLAVGLLIARN